MARDKNHDDDMQDRSDSGGYGASGSRKEHTSNFNTLLSEDGQFFGMSVTPDISSKLDIIYNSGLDWLRRKVELNGAPAAEKFAKSFLEHNPTQAMEFGLKAGSALGFATIFGKQIYEVFNSSVKAGASFKDLRAALSPLKGAAGVAPLSGNNEVVVNARGKMYGIWQQRLVSIATSAIGAAPALIMKIQDKHVTDSKLLKQKKFEAAQNDPEAMAKLIEEEMGLSLSLGGGKHAVAIETVIEGQQKKYLDNLKKFKTEHEKEIKDALKEALKITHEDIYEKLPALRRLGVSTDRLEQIKNITENKTVGGQTLTPEQQIEAVIKQFKTFNEKDSQLKALVNEAVMAKYVKTHGAFTRDDARYYKFGEERSYSRTEQSYPIIKEELEKKFAEIEKNRHQAKLELEKGHGAAAHGKDNSVNSEVFRASASAGATLVGQIATKATGGKTLEKLEQPITLDYILHMRRTLEKAGDNAPDRVSGIPLKNGKSEPDMGYMEYVHKKIFQQHQQDCHRVEIGDRQVAHFEGKHWKDSEIDKIPDEELTAYEFAVKTIAKRIENGRMDAISLIHLVGDRQKKMVSDDGQYFGPNGHDKDDASVKAAILRVVDEQTAMRSGEQTEQQINNKLGDFVFSVEDLKKALESKDMEPEQRAFIFTVFSDIVGSDEKLCTKIGVSKERCLELRKESQKTFDATLDSAVHVLADMIQNQPDELAKHMKITDKEKELILSLAGRADGKSISDATEKREDFKLVETAALNAVVALKDQVAEGEDGKPQSFWRRLVSRSKKKEEEVKEDAAEHKEHAAHDRHSGKHHHTDEEHTGEQRHSAKHRRPAPREESWGDTVQPHASRKGHDVSPTTAI